MQYNRLQTINLRNTTIKIIFSNFQTTFQIIRCLAAPIAPPLKPTPTSLPQQAYISLIISTMPPSPQTITTTTIATTPLTLTTITTTATTTARGRCPVVARPPG